MKQQHGLREHLKECRIDYVFRHGNYFVVAGWQSLAQPWEITQSFKLSRESTSAVPEFSLAYPAEQNVRSHAKISAALTANARFIHWFWIKEGFEISISPEALCLLDLLHAESGELVSGIPGEAICEIGINTDKKSNYPLYLSYLSASQNPDAWLNRLSLEIVETGSLLQRLQYLDAASLQVSVGDFLILVEKLFGAAAFQVRSDVLRMLTAKLGRTGTDYISSEVRGMYVDNVRKTNLRDCPLELISGMIGQLLRINEKELAWDIFDKAVSIIGADRGAMGSLLHTIFPKNSRWWIRHVMGNGELGAEQAADAINVLATAAMASGNTRSALSLFNAAFQLDPLAQSAAINAGWLKLDASDLPGAMQCFSSVSRHYPTDSASTFWPLVSGRHWPHAKMNSDGFSLPNGVGKWPRISIVTPSYNQASYIEETILSILNQGYPNLQYIVVDGLSTDGTIDVLERYRSQIDILLIEKDDGQTEAINKGFRLVDGDLVAWLNSDDMYAPGALHMAALAYIRNKSDVIAGICFEHADNEFLLVNKPAANPQDFTPGRLGRIFSYWLKGHYFYQPEVFFSKSALDAAGLLDESLYYSMDYDLWVRLALNHAKLDVVGWPFAFFRKHDQQKTTKLVDCIEEQSRVRTRYIDVSPSLDRSFVISNRLRSFLAKKHPTVGIITKRISKIFSFNIQEELSRFLGEGVVATISDGPDDPAVADADLVIQLVHVLEDLEMIKSLRQSRPDRAIVGWFWDNHHHQFDNYAIAEALDVVIPGHRIYSEYLRNDSSLLLPSIPLCVTQWSRQDVAQWFDGCGMNDRSGLLYGGFVDYAFEPTRIVFLRKLMESLGEHRLSILSESNIRAYFGRPEKDRFAEWCQFQASLVLPLRNDLSQRVFDALLAGQIPLVPIEITDLDEVFPETLQQSLPILRFSLKSPDSALDAYRNAIRLFAEEGVAGARKRHEYALEHHMFSSRINEILDSLRRNSM